MSTPPLLSPSIAPTPRKSTRCRITLDGGKSLPWGWGLQTLCLPPIRWPGGAGVSSGPSPALALHLCQSPALYQKGLAGSVPIRYSPQGDRAPSWLCQECQELPWALTGVTEGSHLCRGRGAAWPPPHQWVTNCS